VTARRSLFSRKPPAKPASDLPPLKRLERVVNPVRHSAHITPTVDEMFDTWMREHGVKFIPAVEGLVRAVLQEDDEYKDRVADFTARHGRLPSPDEVPRGPIHQALRPQLEELAKGGV
jgi:hypothetical protein